MDHRPFEEWLLEDKPLNKEERQVLQEHLRTCTSCTALSEVDLALRGARMASPVQGFADRLQVRLAAERKARRIRQGVGFTFLALGAIGMLFWISWPILAAATHSPSGMISDLLMYLSRLFLNLRAFGQALSVVGDVMKNFIPSYVWMIIISALGGMGLLWVATLKKFTRIPQGA
jgi:hypothetical protein